MHHCKRLLFAEMEAVSKNNVETKAREHRKNREHSDALAKALPLVKDGVPLEQSGDACIVFFFA